MNLSKIALKHDSNVDLNQQLYEELRRLILGRKLEPGHRLPPTRTLAKDLGVARKTVVSAYDQLASEGYLRSKTGAGTFVSGDIQDSAQVHEPRSARSSGRWTNRKTDSLPLSPYALHAASTKLLPPIERSANYTFHSWQPAFDEIPATEWARAVTRLFRSDDSRLLDYSDTPAGYPPLREAIANRLEKTRGIQCTREQVIITCGQGQCIDMVARLHIEPGSEALFENPSYPPARDIFKAYGANIRSVSVDKSGLRTSNLSRLSDHKIAVVYITPSHQYPTGAILSLPRRLELLKWAREHNAVIIEDDFDSEFRYRGQPIPALKTLD